jgi:copper ion binding protein
MQKANIQLETLTCPSCLQKIENAVKNLEGIETVKVLFNASKAKVTHDEDIVTKEDIKNAIEAVGYEVKNIR